MAHAHCFFFIILIGGNFVISISHFESRTKSLDVDECGVFYTRMSSMRTYTLHSYYSAGHKPSAALYSLQGLWE